MTEPDALLRSHHVAAWLAVDISTLSKWHRRGYGPKALKVGRGLRYKRSDVEQWLLQQAADGAA